MAFVGAALHYGLPPGDGWPAFDDAVSFSEAFSLPVGWHITAFAVALHEALADETLVSYSMWSQGIAT